MFLVPTPNTDKTFGSRLIADRCEIVIHFVFLYYFGGSHYRVDRMGVSNANPTQMRRSGLDLLRREARLFILFFCTISTGHITGWTECVFLVPTPNTDKAFGSRFTADRGEIVIYFVFLYYFDGPHYRVDRMCVFCQPQTQISFWVPSYCG